MDNVFVTAQSERFARLARELDDRAFRASYMEHHLKAFLADQIRGLRGGMSQTDFGRLIGKPQSVVSRLEDESYGRITLQTLIDIATRLDIAFVGRFVDFPAFLEATMDFSEAAVTPRPYDTSVMDAFMKAPRPEPDGALRAFFSASREQNQSGLHSASYHLPSETLFSVAAHERGNAKDQNMRDMSLSQDSCLPWSRIIEKAA